MFIRIKHHFEHFAECDVAAVLVFEFASDFYKTIITSFGQLETDSFTFWHTFTTPPS